MTIIEIENLSAGYEGKVIIEKCNLSIQHDDFIGIIGPNGGGKTTFLKALMGLIPLRTGQIRVFDNEKQVPKILIGYLPQINHIDKKFPITVREVVLSGLIQTRNWLQLPSKNTESKLQHNLQLLGIESLQHKIIGELSGGQMQRAFLGRAIIASPKLLVLDEPSTFVDSNFESELYDILENLNKEMAIVMVNHDLGTISSRVKTIACVNRNFNYHPSNEVTTEMLEQYHCPMDIIAHGAVPHRILHNHN